jgi:tetratricopeptide (TPR) repeat protein
VALTRALDISPESSWANYDLACFELLQGRAPEALDLFSAAGPAWREVGVSMAEHSLGHATESRQALDAAIEDHAHTSAYQIAEAMAWRGDIDGAFAWLERAYEQHDGGLSNIKTDVMLAPVRTDPRYAAMLKKMDLPP